MNYYVNCDGIRKITNNISLTQTYLNDEYYSRFYGMVDGPDKLYRVFDLYKGIINPRNENDVKCIHLGYLSQDAYDLKGLKEITEKEDSLVGKTLEMVSEEYINYLKKFLYEKFGCKGELNMDRKSMLSGITNQKSETIITKDIVEKKLGIPYETFEKLDLDEQHRLIEQKTKKKVKPDYRLFIDGIPIDEEHIITGIQIDKRIDELAEREPKKLLKKLFKEKKQ